MEEKYTKGVKITRGISEEFAEAFKKCELYALYTSNKDELIVGVRNDYLNIYYNCDSIAKVTYKSQSKEIVCKIDQYYLDGKSRNSKDKYKTTTLDPKELVQKYEEIKTNSNKKMTNEKKAQSELYILNNSNKDSNWFCIDVEYVKAFKNKKEKNDVKFNARFDIIAITKSKDKFHRVALIELKYAKGAIGGKSGIYKHINDFSKFQEQNFFEKHLQEEIIHIIKSQADLGIELPFAISSKNELSSPEFFFITLDNNSKNNKSTPKQTMAGYLFKDKRWGCNKLSTKNCVETDFGDVTKKSNKFNASFLFSKEKLDSSNKLTILDIIDGNYDEKIFPE